MRYHCWRPGRRTGLVRSSPACDATGDRDRCLSDTFRQLSAGAHGSYRFPIQSGLAVSRPPAHPHTLPLTHPPSHSPTNLISVEFSALENPPRCLSYSSAFSPLDALEVLSLRGYKTQSCFFSGFLRMNGFGNLSSVCFVFHG